MIEDKSYGVIVVSKDKFLILKQTSDYWGFPKGHAEGVETAKEAALRELKEETGIANCDIFDTPPIYDEYTFIWTDGKDYHKIVEYFIGLAEDEKVVMQEDEILEYKWATYEEAIQTLTYDNSKKILQKAKEYLDKYESEK